MKKSLDTKIAALIARCWTDQEFKQRFVREPKVVLAEILLDLPPGGELVVIEDSSQRRHLVIPQPPADGFSAEDVGMAARNFLEPASALYCIGETPALAPSSADKVEEFAAPYCLAPEKVGELGALYCVAPEKAVEFAALYCLAPERAVELAALYCLPVERAIEPTAPYCLPSDKGKSQGDEPNHSTEEPSGDK